MPVTDVASTMMAIYRLTSPDLGGLPLLAPQAAMRALQVETVKGIFWPAVSANQSRNYVLRAPALPVTALPYHALAPISSASGKALWHAKPTRDIAFDLLLCLRVPPGR